MGGSTTSFEGGSSPPGEVATRMEPAMVGTSPKPAQPAQRSTPPARASGAVVLPGLRDLIFSIKAFASAMLALYIAFSIDLERPYWAMTTAYIVMQPWTAAMRSKGMWRFCGTLLSGTVAIALVPNLANAPELLSFALTVWLGVGLYFCLLDRTARSYVFRQSGYTAGIIGFPAVLAPDQVFDTALTRLEEITLGIMCATVIDSIVFPRPLGPALLQKIEAWFGYGRDWCVAVLSGNGAAAAARANRRLLAATSVELGMLASQLSLDPSYLHSATRPLAVLRGRIVAMLPVLGGIEDWHSELTMQGGMSVDLRALMDRISGWIAAGLNAPQAEGEVLQEEVRQARASQPPPSVWRDVVRAALLARLDELVAIVLDVRALQRHIAAGGANLPPLALPSELAPDTTLWRDHGMALLSAMAAVTALGLVCLVWIGTAWPNGATAATTASILCCLFATKDDPTPTILTFLAFTVVAIAIDAVYLFAILPRVTDFTALVLALAPVWLVAGALMQLPATAVPAMAVAVQGSSLLALSDTYNANFADFANNSLAFIAGAATAAVVTSLMRSVGAEWSAQRLRRVTRRAIAAAASQPRMPDRPGLLAGMLDRLGALTSRLAAVDPHADGGVTGALADIRVGLAVAALRIAGPTLTADARAATTVALAALAQHYRRSTAEAADGALRADLDRAIARLAGSTSGAFLDALLCLACIRYILFRSASPFLVPTG